MTHHETNGSQSSGKDREALQKLAMNLCAVSVWLNIQDRPLTKQDVLKASHLLQMKADDLVAAGREDQAQKLVAETAPALQEVLRLDEAAFERAAVMAHAYLRAHALHDSQAMTQGMGEGNPFIRRRSFAPQTPLEPKGGIVHLLRRHLAAVTVWGLLGLMLFLVMTSIVAMVR